MLGIDAFYGAMRMSETELERASDNYVRKLEELSRLPKKMSSKPKSLNLNCYKVFAERVIHKNCGYLEKNISDWFPVYL